MEGCKEGVCVAGPKSTIRKRVKVELDDENIMRTEDIQLSRFLTTRDYIPFQRTYLTADCPSRHLDYQHDC